MDEVMEYVCDFIECNCKHSCAVKNILKELIQHPIVKEQIYKKIISLQNKEKEYEIQEK